MKARLGPFESAPEVGNLTQNLQMEQTSCHMPGALLSLNMQGDAGSHKQEQFTQKRYDQKMGQAFPECEGLGSSPVVPQGVCHSVLYLTYLCRVDRHQVTGFFMRASCTCMRRFITKNPLPNLLAQKAAQKMEGQCRQSMRVLVWFAAGQTQPTPKHEVC